MKTIFILIWLSLASSCTHGQGTTTYTVFPIGMEAVNGNNGDTLFQLVPIQRQQVTLGSYLQQVWTTPVLINELAFRVENGRGDLSAVIPSVELRLSTTTRIPNNLSPEWRFNVGADGRTVYQANNIPLSAAGGTGPNPFDLRFSLSEPFLYDASAGNLLMFVSVGGSGEILGGQPIDMHSFLNFTVSPTGSIGGGFANPHPSAWVTEIGWVSVPEASISQLFRFGALALMLPKTLQREREA